MNFYLLLAVLISLISASPTYIKEFNRQSQPTNLAVPFTLSAHFPGNVIDGLQFQANSYHFYLGLNRSSAYCPAVVGKACPNSTATVVINGAMYVMVPGGQHVYIQRSGALTFTVPHSGALIDLYSTSVAAATDGIYRGPWGVYWSACPVVNTTNVWQVFARIPPFSQQNCLPFEARAQNWTGGIGAWEYI